MPVDLGALFDPASAAFVLGGTAIATAVRCGWDQSRAACAALVRFLSFRVAEQANRAALARAITEIERRGYLCADIPTPPDPHLADALNHYRRKGSASAMVAREHDRRAERDAILLRAIQPFEQAGELAPVLGLAGTLIAIAQLTQDGAVGETGSLVISAAIAGAVLSSLYGVFLAHFIALPLGQAIKRKALRDETVRADLLEWAAILIENRRDADPAIAMRTAA